MSQGVPASSKKQSKKAQRDADRQRDRGKKRKHGDIAEDESKVDFEKDFLPLDDEGHDTEAYGESAPSAAPQKTSGKRKQSISQLRTRSPLSTEVSGEVQAPTKRRKPNEPTEAPHKDGKSRFIVFIGNLPYSATDASLNLHFQKLAPFTLRHRIDPKTKKSKGFAFLEFENFDRMKTCLKLYHHSMFDPEAKESAVVEDHQGEDEDVDATAASIKANTRNRRARRINVELTAGGGGKNENRKEKIKAKNVRLEEQRKRRAELERKEKEKIAAKKAKRTGANKLASVEERTETTEQRPVEDNNSGIHPSRLARLNQ